MFNSPQKGLVILLLFLNTAAGYALDVPDQGRANFVLGRAFLEKEGKEIQLKTGMMIPHDAVIRTEKGSRISIYDFKSRRVISIKPNVRIVWNKSDTTSGYSPVFLRKLLKNKSRRAYSTTTAGVRASEEGKVSVDWYDEGDEQRSSQSRIHEWKLYRKGQYSKVLRLTQGAKDPNGIYLETLSLYMLEKFKERENLIKKLQEVIKKSPERNLRLESRKMIAILHYEVGAYLEALSSFEDYINKLAGGDIDDLVYYLMIVSYRNIGKEKESSLYLEKMKSVHPESKFLKNL